MGKYIITKSFWHKGYVFLFSYVQSMAMACWSTHKCEQQLEKTRQYAKAFQEEHDKQLDGFVAQELDNLAKEKMKQLVIDDQTEQSRVILNSKQ
jgi:hypothetical protein